MSFKISACTIAKNEEKNIARSIESYKKYVDEIIIVDTGSTDDTAKIAESLGAKVVNFEWINDFSAARNFAIGQATGDWILFLDADEWIKDNQGEKLQSIIKNAVDNGLHAISFRMHNLNDDGSLDDIISSLRLFENKPNIRYIRKIHEHLIDFNNEKPLVSLKSEDLILNHCGYADSISEKKIERNKLLLEKNYMEGNLQALDYFYLARENLLENPEYTEKFLDILTKDEEKMADISKVAITNNISDLKIKLIKVLGNKYSLKEKICVVDEAIKTFPDDPAYYFFKYLILEKAGKLNELELISKAIELEKNYESKISTNNNSFIKYKADALYELGQAKLLENDNLAAMNYFVEAIMTGQMREEVLRDLMYIIEEQPTNEKIAFLNSIFDVNNEMNLKFIIQSLRLTKYGEIFLYYFVKFYKLSGEVDISLFTSMMLGKNYEEVADKYLGLFLNGSDKKAEILVVSAIIAGELKEFYEKNKVYFSLVARKILNAYFNDFSIEEITKVDEALINEVISEIIYIAPKDVLEKIKKTFDYSENVLRKIIRIYAKNKNYKELLEEINTFIQKDLSDEFAGEVTAKLGECFFKLNDFVNSEMYFNQAINIGYLDINVYKFYRLLSEKVAVSSEMKEKFDEYSYLLEKFIFANNYMLSENIDEIEPDLCCKTIEEFENMSQLNVTETFNSVFFSYASKAFDMGKLYLAEEYYKILIRSNYNLGKCYYNLGNIYNKLGIVDLSYFCYEKAFKTSIKFPSIILPENHKNKNYLYRMFEQKETKICPICGEESELKYCYQYVEDENLTDNSVLIVKYRKCNKCSHIFAENHINHVNYLEKIKEKEQYIFNSYDLKEKLEEGSKLVVLDETNLMAKSLEDDFDVEFVKGSFEKNSELKELLNSIDKSKDRILVTLVNNIDSPFNEDVTMPLWAKVGVVNAYSKKSIRKLLEDNGYKKIKIYDSKFVPGKMTIVACM